MRQLEQAYANTDRFVLVEAYFAETEEDAQFNSWTGRAVGFTDDRDNGQGQSHRSLSGSGYNSVRVVWEDQEEDTLSPWEVSLKDAMPPQRPTLADEEKRTIRRALNNLKGLPNIDAFRSPVDESFYSDYRTRVEVPMDLTFITTRLEADYYSTKYSVVADVRLIHTNCAKYNGDFDDLTELSAQLVAAVENNVFSDEEKEFFHKYDLPISGVPLDSLVELGNGGSDLSSAPLVIQRRPQRHCRPPRSVLEDITGSSPEECKASRSARVNRSIRATVRRAGAQLPGSESSVLEAVEQPEVAPTLEQLSSNGRARGRTATTRQNNQRELTSSRNIPQRSARLGSRNSVYQDPSSDIDEETEHSMQASSHRSLRPGLRNSQVQYSSPSDVEGNRGERRASFRRTTRSTAQGEPRRLQIRIRSAPFQAAKSDDEPEELLDEEVGQVIVGRRSLRSTRSSLTNNLVPETDSRPTNGGNRAGTKRSRSNSDTDDAISEKELHVKESDFEDDIDGQENSSEPESEPSTQASSSNSDVASKKKVKARLTRSQSAKSEDWSVEQGRKKAPRKRDVKAAGSQFRSSHARGTQHRTSSYVDPSESEFGSDIDSPESITQERKRQKGNSLTKKNNGLFIHMLSFFESM